MDFQVNLQKETPAYFLFNWILNVLVFGPISFIAIMAAFAFTRRLLQLPPSSQVPGDDLREECSIRIQQNILKLGISICTLYGLGNFPLVSAVFFGFMATPGHPDLPDYEVFTP